MKKNLHKNFFFPLIFILSFFTSSVTKAAWTYTLSTPTPTPAANVCPGTTKVPLYYFTIFATGSGTASNITQNFTFTTNAGYAASSISQFSLYRNTSNSLGTAVLMNSATASGPGLQTISAAFTYGLSTSNTT